MLDLAQSTCRVDLPEGFDVAAPVDLRSAEAITGGLSNPEKMPGFAWGLPTHACVTGSQLRDVAGSVCGRCYAHERNRFAWGPVKAAYERRLAGIWHPQWVEAMVTTMLHRITIGEPWFRWFDSGDLQAYTMGCNILEVGARTPLIHHWLQTRELKWAQQLLAQEFIPPNVTLRVSGTMIDGLAPKGFPNSTRVLSKGYKASWQRLMRSSTKDAWFCPAPLQDNKCGNCRACWNRDVRVVHFLEK